MELHDMLSRLRDFVPFILSAGQSPKINKARLVESLIMAAVIGGISYGTFKQRFDDLDKLIAVQISAQQASIDDLKRDMRDLRNQISRGGIK